MSVHIICVNLNEFYFLVKYLGVYIYRMSVGFSVYKCRNYIKIECEIDG